VSHVPWVTGADSTYLLLELSNLSSAKDPTTISLLLFTSLLFPSEDGSQKVKVISRAKKRNRIFIP
jgi:hypothetical protein